MYRNGDGDGGGLGRGVESRDVVFYFSLVFRVVQVVFITDTRSCCYIFMSDYLHKFAFVG